MQIRSAIPPRYRLAQEIADQALRQERREERAERLADNADSLILAGGVSLGAGLLGLAGSHWLPGLARAGSLLCLAGAGMALPCVVVREAARHDAHQAHVVSVGLRLAERRLIK